MRLCKGMLNKWVVFAFALALSVALSGTSFAREWCPPYHLKPQPVRLRQYEPIFLGWSWDSYGTNKGYLDATLSLQYPIAADCLQDGNRFHMLPYISGTVRFSQYIGSRDSNPVVLKRFNPQVFLRYSSEQFPTDGRSPNSYIDFQYGHESNGQSVDNQTLFDETANSVGGTENAKDYISRGWDYLGIAFKAPATLGEVPLSLYLDRKWYCGCLLQRDIEERFPFEAPRDIQSIRQVKGWRAMARYDTTNHNDLIDHFVVDLNTGTRDTFKYLTGRFEIGSGPVDEFVGVPLILWGQTGYLSDIAQYYRKAHSYGIALIFKTVPE